MAGLCAAYELEKLGHDITVLEAEPAHLGGRVRTMRFAGGQLGELGAMRIPVNHHLTRQYISNFGLQLRPFVQYNPNAYYYANGRRERIRDAAHMNPKLTLGMDGRAASEWSQAFDEIVGGMDTLAEAFAARLKSKPRTGCAVSRIVQDSPKKQVTAIYRDSGPGSSSSRGTEQTISAIICCVRCLCPYFVAFK